MHKAYLYFQRFVFPGKRNWLFSLVVFISVMPQQAFSQSRDIKIKSAIDRGGHFLQNIQRPNGSICDTLNPLFNTWETILATTALYEINPDTNNNTLKSAFAYLRQNENPEGLICHNQKCRMGYCLETTSFYFSLLLKIGEGVKVQQRLGPVILLQKETGEWEIGNPDVREQKKFPSVTAFILSVLHESGPGDPLNRKSYEWLINMQNQEGNWGQAWEYYGCPAYALWAALKALQFLNTEQAVAARKKATRYICSQQQKNGSWFFRDTLHVKQTSAEFQTSLMLLALQEADSENMNTIEKGVDFLLSQQSLAGYWNGGYFPVPASSYTKEEYVMATSLSLIVLRQALKPGKN